MVKKTTGVHYATNVHGQPNANLKYAKYYVGWANAPNASAKTYSTKPQGSAMSYYYNENKHQKPVTLTAHDFDFNLPSCAYITKITFTARIKASGKINVKAPYARFNIYNGSTHVDTYCEDDTGWDDGYWYYNPNKKLSNTWQEIDYVLTGTEFRKRGYPISSLNDIIMGIDLRWYASKELVNSTIKLDYVSCVIEYELAEPRLTFDTVTSEDNPRWTNAGETYTVVVNYTNRSNASCCNGTSKNIQVTVPHNAIVEGYNSSYDASTGIWTVPCTPNASSKLELEITDYSIGEDKINFLNEDIGDYDYWVYSAIPDHDVGEIRAFPGTMQKGVVSCVDYSAIVLSTNGRATVNVNVDTVNNSNPDLTWSIDYDYTMPDVTIASSSNSQIVFNVPRNEERHIFFKSCFIPSVVGNTNVRAVLNNSSRIVPYEVLDVPIFRVRNATVDNDFDRSVSEILFNPSVINFQTHRVASSTELGAYVLDCGVADYDGSMVLDECSLTASTWERLDYIGMIPLEYHHYDPKSTFENKGIKESYKNKTYKGKEGIIDEDISLKFKIRPKQAPTLHGLIELDKPTPINANHKCFEGDVLNHRGWVVLSKAEIERTNPLWYDVDATVDYITHDITTKFQIHKGLAVNNVSMPDVQEEVFELGSNLSTGLSVFNIDTDGGFVYDEDGEDGAKNIFSLDEGQHLLINTLNPLTDVAHVRFDWYSNRIDELRENEMSRIFRLKDRDGNSVFEYEYCDFEFEDDFVTCTVIIRVKNNTGGWNEAITLTKVDLSTEIEADPIAVDDTTDEDFTEVVLDEEDIVGDTTDESDDEIDDDAYEEGYIAPEFNPEEYDISLIYGTSLELILNGNNLSILDRGYNGSEVEQNVTLVGEDFVFETLWVNNNSDGTTEDIISYIDISLTETVLNTLYSSKYSNLMVSPFPIPYKTVVFTRESEEGTIYYLTGDEPFKYLIEPFYQYHCGTDMVTREGVSLFNLNNSYTHFYIENGLVRLGFNKLNGRLSLSKWDIASKTWVTTHHFQMSNDIKFSLAKYSDDKIVIKAGTDTLFTIWRGHPYIMVQNTKDIINITSDFNYAYGDNIDNTKYDYPVVCSFLNTNNLLPASVGGVSLDKDSVTINDDMISGGTNHTITLNIPNLTALADNTLGVTLSPSTTAGKVHFLVNGVEVGKASSPFTVTTDAFDKVGAYTVQAVYTGDDNNNIAISDKVTVNVSAPEPDDNTKADTGTPDAPSGKYKLEIVSAPSSFTFYDKKQVILQLTRGDTVCKGMIVEVQLPTGHTESRKTDANGQVYITNNDVDYVPGKYQWGGRFYDDWDEEGNISGNIMLTALKWIEIKKATPTFAHNAPSGRVTKGNDFIVKLKGVAGGLDGKKLIYGTGVGTKKTKTTNAKGNIHIPCNTKGTFYIVVNFAGSTRYNAIGRVFTIKVV